MSQITTGSNNKVVSEDNPLPVYVVSGGTGGGSGDMEKRVYDTNDDGRVDQADHAITADSATTAETATNATNAVNATNAEQAEVANHATTADSATNAVHANTADSATTAETANVANSVSFENVTEKPENYPPSAHNHNDLYYTKSESDGVYATIESLNEKLTAVQISAQDDSVAEDVEALVADFNSLLEKLRVAGIMES